MIRAFVALEVEASLLTGAAKLGEALRGGDCATLRATWVHAARMHVTARFLGDVEEESVARLASTLEVCARGQGSFEVRATTLGAFPDARRARVLVVPLTDDGEAEAIVAKLEDELVGLGFPRETRAYVPHLTLARFREPADVRAVVATKQVAMKGRAIRLALFRSELGPQGPTYTELAGADLGRA